MYQPIHATLSVSPGTHCSKRDVSYPDLGTPAKYRFEKKISLVVSELVVSNNVH